MKNLSLLWMGDEGQGLTEYGLLIGVFVVAVIGALMLLGPKVWSLYSNTNAQFN